MSDAKEITCICCPKGCRITATPDGELQATDQTCKRGLAYAREELTSPKRIVTAVVRTDSERFRYVPVKTDQPLEMQYIDSLLNKLYRMKVSLPVSVGITVLKNFEQTGVNVVITRSMQDTDGTCSP